MKMRGFVKENRLKIEIEKLNEKIKMISKKKEFRGIL